VALQPPRMLRRRQNGGEGRGRLATEGEGRVGSAAFGCDGGSGAAGGEAATRGQGGAAEGRPPRGGSPAKWLLRIVWAAAAAYDGSNEQRAGYRQEAYAMCNHFRLPQVSTSVRRHSGTTRERSAATVVDPALTANGV